MDFKPLNRKERKLQPEDEMSRLNGAVGNKTALQFYGLEGGPSAQISMNVIEKAPVIQFGREEFRHEFAGPSIGVEQELNEYKIRLGANKEKCLAEVRRKSDREILLLITVDLGVGELFTIELVTSPTEREPVRREGWTKASIDDRKNALTFAVAQIQNAASHENHLIDIENDDLLLHVINQTHLIEKAGSGEAVTAGNQVTVGIPLADVSAFLNGNAGQWYQDGRYQDDSLITMQEEMLFNYVMCCVTFIVGKSDLASADTKNAWGTLPRTPPWAMVERIFANDEAAKRRIKTAVTQAGVPGATSTEAFLAKQRIFIKESFAHTSFVSSIDDEPAFVFELRHPGDYQWGSYLYPFEEHAGMGRNAADEASRRVHSNLLSDLHKKFASSDQ